MAQYQSFPGAPGDSLTLDKLKALSLPDLEGRSFLDVGCNEGFFCGFAKFLGASRSVGVDHSIGFIERARKRFIDCEFYARTWDDLPEGPFDVILLASALHYADDQPALLSRLVELLSQDGMLVVELGIVTSKKSEWVKVQRGIDERNFPTMPLLREILADYAWKWMGPSVSQAGDPVKRHVLHISRRRRAAYLLMQPPAFGKSSISRSLFPKAEIPVVSGDQVIGRVVAGKLKAPDLLVEALNHDYSPFRIDIAIQRIFDQGLGPDLVQLWIDQAGPLDFAVDMYVPVQHQAAVKKQLSDAGYLPIVLDWQRPGSDLLPQAVLQERAEAFYLSLANSPAPESGGPTGLTGFVDEVAVSAGKITLRGWAADPHGIMPVALAVRLNGATCLIESFEKQFRPDVQKHLSLPHALVGYRAEIQVDGVDSVHDLGASFMVSGIADNPANSSIFSLSAGLIKKLQQGAQLDEMSSIESRPKEEGS